MDVSKASEETLYQLALHREAQLRAELMGQMPVLVRELQKWERDGRKEEEELELARLYQEGGQREEGQQQQQVHERQGQQEGQQVHETELRSGGFQSGFQSGFQYSVVLLDGRVSRIQREQHKRQRRLYKNNGIELLQLSRPTAGHGAVGAEHGANKDGDVVQGNDRIDKMEVEGGAGGGEGRGGGGGGGQEVLARGLAEPQQALQQALQQAPQSEYDIAQHPQQLHLVLDERSGVLTAASTSTSANGREYGGGHGGGGTQSGSHGGAGASNDVQERWFGGTAQSTLVGSLLVGEEILVEKGNRGGGHGGSRGGGNKKWVRANVLKFVKKSKVYRLQYCDGKETDTQLQQVQLAPQRGKETDTQLQQVQLAPQRGSTKGHQKEAATGHTKEAATGHTKEAATGHTTARAATGHTTKEAATGHTKEAATGHTTASKPKKKKAGTKTTCPLEWMVRASGRPLLFGPKFVMYQNKLGEYSEDER
jgi:hypothetical protein